MNLQTLEKHAGHALEIHAYSQGDGAIYYALECYNCDTVLAEANTESEATE
jgi:hypothetical protein